MTPYYLLDERRLLRNLKQIQRLRELSGARLVLALKCFAAWSVFDLMKPHLDGVTSSGVYEARLGREKFGGEVHAFSVGYTRADVRAARVYADKLIFNSRSQLDALGGEAGGLPLGLRVNPGFSYSRYDLADPARRFSRLGVRGKRAVQEALDRISGVMFHFNCENGDLGNFKQSLARLSHEYGRILKRLEWVSLGGGLAFTQPDYPLAELAAALRAFSQEHDVQLYLEPGEAVITGCGELVTTVLDVVRNGAEIAIVDASVEAHMLDHLIYRTSPRLAAPAAGQFPVIIAGRSCLAGDVFGRYRLQRRLRPGSQVRFADAAGYTMVKKNWFNGLPMPSIRVRRLDGRLETVRTFTYEEYAAGLS